jgi:sulfide:quinone oxidoreductase
MSPSNHHQVLIVGGGTAGISVTARLTRGWRRSLDVAVIEPSDKHYYQPLWTLVGAGVFPKQASQRPEASVMPRRATWIRDAVATFDPDQNALVTRDGRRITYDWLVVAGGIQLNWGAIAGLRNALGHDGVCSNYSFQTVDSTWNELRNFRGGTAVFTHPSGAVKCGGAPQKIMYLADDHLRRAGVREKSRIVFAAATPSIFAVEKYRHTLDQVVARKDIECLFRNELIEVRGPAREAVFRNLDTQQTTVVRYDLLHVTPPMSAPDFIANSPLADAHGWVEVDKHSLRHVRYANVFALGDCSNLPTSKTGAAVRKQAPTLVRNLKAAIDGLPMPARYEGYTSCPLVTGYGKLVLAEFDYDKHPAETFPFDQSRERRSMYWLKKYLLPFMYWHGMLKGRM